MSKPKQAVFSIGSVVSFSGERGLWIVTRKPVPQHVCARPINEMYYSEGYLRKDSCKPMDQATVIEGGLRDGIYRFRLFIYPPKKYMLIFAGCHRFILWEQAKRHWQRKYGPSAERPDTDTYDATRIILYKMWQEAMKRGLMDDQGNVLQPSASKPKETP